MRDAMNSRVGKTVPTGVRGRRSTAGLNSQGARINPAASKLVLVRDPTRAYRMVLGADRLDRRAAIYPQSLCDRRAANARGVRRGHGPLGMPRPRRSERSREAITPSNWNTGLSKTIIGC